MRGDSSLLGRSPRALSLINRFNNYDNQNDNIIVKFSEPFSTDNIITITAKNNENLKVMIFDIYGKLIKSGEIFGQGDHNINMSDYCGLQHGTYIIRISSDKTNITKKIVF